VIKLIACIACCSILITAKAQFVIVSQKFATEDWVTSAPFTNTEVKAEWKNESVVILADKWQYYYNEPKDGIISYYITNRKRIKIQNEAGLKAYAEIKYGQYADRELKLIKPDGTVAKLNMDGEKAGGLTIVGKKVSYNMKYKIPELAVGDIIDYYLTEKFNFKKDDPAINRTVFASLKSEYPIAYQEYEFLLYKQFSFNFKSLNGAPGMQAKLHNYKGETIDKPEKAEYQQINFSASDIDKAVNIRFNNRLLTEPAFKFKVYHETDIKSRKPLQSERLRPRTDSPDNAEIAAYIFRSTTTKLHPSYYYGEMLGHIKSLSDVKLENRTTADLKKEVEAIFYSYRHFCYEKENRKLLAKYFNDFEASEAPGGYGNETFDNDNEHALHALIKVLDSREIKYEIIATVPRNIGTASTAVMDDEFELVLKINFKSDESWYISGVTRYSGLEYGNYQLEGTKGVLLDPSSTKKEIKFKEVTLPTSSFGQNSYKNSKTIEITDNMTVLNIESVHIYTGYSKIEASNKRLFISDYFHQDGRQFRSNHKETPATYNKQQYLEIQKVKADKKEPLRNKLYQQQLESQIENATIKNYDDVNVIKTGRAHETELHFQENYQVEGSLKQGGADFSLNLNHLIDKQIKLGAEEYERNIDAYFDYANTQEHDINIKIPDGYNIENLEPFNVKIDNAAGKFITSVFVANGKIFINCELIFKRNMVTKENWKMMTDVLDAAYQFSQQKIILKKQ
jgi:hypothetical protein